MKSVLKALSLVFALVLTSEVASAEPFDEGVAELATNDFERVTSGAQKIGSSSSPKALEVLVALEEGNLEVDAKGLLFILSKSGAKAVTSNEAATPPLRIISVNNRVRRALGLAIATKRLESSDVSVRREAALEMAKQPTQELLESLRKAAKKETEPGIFESLTLAVARLDLQSDDRSRRLDALRAIEEYADLSFKPDLEGLRATVPASDKELASALYAAGQAIDRKLFFVNSVANTFYGASLGSVLLLAALGLAITFGLMRVINMAHGEMLMLGAYATFCVQKLFVSYLPSLSDFYLLAAIPFGFLATAAVGVLLERFVVKRLYGRPLETLLSTWGLSLILIQTVRLLFGAQNVTVANPTWLSGGFELLPNLVLPYSRIAIVGFSASIVGGIALLLTKTSFGLQIRAVTQNRAMASSMGIPAERVDSLTFGLGSGLAGLGGVALSQLGNVGPELGQTYIVDSFMVVVLGGVGKLLGTVIGATGLGVLNKYLEPAFGAVLGKIAILGLIIVFLQSRPQGLFALKGRSAEAA